jgi:PKD repeat protein
MALALSSTPVGAAPGYDFTVSPNPPTVRRPATFSVVPKPPPEATVQWDFDGGDFDATGTSVSHTFRTNAPVTVRMRVDSKGPGNGVVAKTITPNRAPRATFTFTPATPAVGASVAFSGGSDPDGDALIRLWRLGDGFSSGDAAPVHAYAAAGNYTASLTVTDVHGAATTTFQTLEVHAPPQQPPPTGQPPPSGGTGTPVKRPVRMRPFPIVRIAGIVLPRGALVRILSVRAPRGANVRVRCRGRGCPVSTVARTSAVRVVRFHRFERVLLAGVRLEIYVRKPGRIGKYTRFRIRAAKPPARVDRCLMPGRIRPVRCS